MRQLNSLLVGLVVACGCGSSDRPEARTAFYGNEKLARADNASNQPAQVNSDKLELVAGFYGPMPTGVAVSKAGRIFVNFPRWGDPVEFTVAELRDGKPVPFPNPQINQWQDGADAKTQLVSVQSVVVDEQDRLWLLDTGSINFQPAIAGGQKLICVDLNTNQIVKTIFFPPDVALRTTYLNDIRFAGGKGFITDSSDAGPNGIIVVDLTTGDSWRRLSDHPSTKAEKDFVPVVEGQPLMARAPGQPAAYLKIGSDGIAISSDHQTLYYCPLAGRHLYSVSVEAMADRGKSDADVAATVKDLGDRGYASDGLEAGADGQIFLTDYEHNAIHVRGADGADRVLVSDPRMIWPDSMSLGADGMLYFTANQLNRQPKFHDGQDKREQPYALFRVPIGGSSPTQTAMR